MSLEKLDEDRVEKALIFLSTTDEDNIKILK